MKNYIETPEDAMTDWSRANLEDLRPQITKKLVGIKNELNAPFEVKLNVTEFVSTCPITGQPDFAKIEISYLLEPRKGCFVEQKSLKEFLNAFQMTDAYQEEITDYIREEVKRITETDKVTVWSYWNARGGISSITKAGIE